MWPAWWLLGNGDKYNLLWPTVGEIDILEMVGGFIYSHPQDQYAYGTVHWNNESNAMHPVNNKQIAAMWNTPDSTLLHSNNLVYWTEWNSTTIRIGVNEFVYSVIDTTHFNNSINPVWAFQGTWPFYMILNIGIGGVWPGPPDNTTIWPQFMVFDWIKVYQRNKALI